VHRLAHRPRALALVLVTTLTLASLPVGSTAATVAYPKPAPATGTLRQQPRPLTVPAPLPPDNASVVCTNLNGPLLRDAPTRINARPHLTLPTRAATVQTHQASGAPVIPGPHRYRAAQYVAPGARARHEVASPSSMSAAIGSPYASAILADHPSIYYRLDETAGPTAFDSSGQGQNGQYGAGVTYNVPGALAGDPDTAVSGTAEILSAPSTALPSGSAARSYEMWFKASTEPSLFFAFLSEVAQNQWHAESASRRECTCQRAPHFRSRNPAPLH